MKTSTSILDRWMRFLGAMLIVALMRVAAIAAGPTTVNLGTAGNFAILGKNANFATTGNHAVVGDIGISPPLRVL